MPFRDPLLPHRWARVEVHVIKLASYPQLAGRDGLSPEEMGLAALIPDPARRAAFRASRLLLREMLAEWLCCPAEEVRLTHDRDGNPRLESREMDLSVACPDGWCAIAATRGSPVGIHAEVMRARDRRSRDFYESWTRLEATLKTGAGIDDVVAESCDSVPGLALTVAVRHPGPVQIDWHIEAKMRLSSLHCPEPRQVPPSPLSPSALKGRRLLA